MIHKIIINLKIKEIMKFNEFADQLSEQKMPLEWYQEMAVVAAENFYDLQCGYILSGAYVRLDDITANVQTLRLNSLRQIKDILEFRFDHPLTEELGNGMEAALKKYKSLQGFLHHGKIWSRSYWKSWIWVDQLEEKFSYLEYLQWRYIYKDRYGTAEDFKQAFFPTMAERIEQINQKYIELLEQ